MFCLCSYIRVPRKDAKKEGKKKLAIGNWDINYDLHLTRKKEGRRKISRKSIKRKLFCSTLREQRSTLVYGLEYDWLCDSPTIGDEYKYLGCTARNLPRAENFTFPSLKIKSWSFCEPLTYITEEGKPMERNGFPGNISAKRFESWEVRSR